MTTEQKECNKHFSNVSSQNFHYFQVPFYGQPNIDLLKMDFNLFSNLNILCSNAAKELKRQHKKENPNIQILFKQVRRISILSIYTKRNLTKQY